MPFIDYQPQSIRVEIPDTIMGGTVIKRKALLTSMFQSLYNDNNPSVYQNGIVINLNVLIEHYAVGPNDANGQATYGERLNTKFPNIDYPYVIVADRNSIVDAATGQKLCDASEYNQAMALKAQNPSLDVHLPAALYNADGTEKNFTSEDKFFANLSDNAPVIVTNLQKQYIQQEAALGKF